MGTTNLFTIFMSDQKREVWDNIYYFKFLISCVVNNNTFEEGFTLL